MSRKWSWLVTLYMGAMVLFLLGPFLVILPVSFGGDNLFQFPPDTWSLMHYQALWSDERVLSSLWSSLYVGAVSTCLAAFVGLLAGLGIVRGNLPFKGLLSSFFLGPLIVPMVTTGIGFLILFVPLGLVDTALGMILAHSVIISPYVVRIVIATLKQFDPLQEEAAMIHGATPWHALITVVLPQIQPALISSAILAFLVSLDEYTVTVFLSQAGMVTLPIRIYQFVSLDINPIVTAIASLMVVISFLFIAYLEKKFHIHRYLEM